MTKPSGPSGKQANHQAPTGHRASSFNPQHKRFNPNTQQDYIHQKNQEPNIKLDKPDKQ